MRIFHFDKLGSTNDYLKEKKDKKEWDLVIADIQTSGRGRRGNLWVSPPGAGLFSFALKEDPNLSMEEYSKLPLIAGIALLKGLKTVVKLNYKFKWTNDIYLCDKKLSGILVEKVGDFFIIGIGININNLEFLGESKNGISLKSVTEDEYEVVNTIKIIMDSFKKYWNRYLRGEWNEILYEINEKNHLLNREIEVEFLGNKVSGIGRKILKNGKLEVETVDGIKEFMVGEVHIKL
ncbi:MULTISPECIES: biotin--[acetyl-CoA-carboxylase] ligase [Psychrilyobacter]|uniref:Biotin--[acetyl-CoA-carboxylase] ligase n=1 Tax=Psychrilyobacter piezotolerans TaxID=2293438 RepID=A0ABX9KGP4_9FUSO|nr:MULTISPECIES: biotin--[acetyl-CoA-carboxylase] ligase [Psychrilyobacter]MCS5420468.1 biotin--[acetyl-CoA-carboxylase] ligase [Psychrilyobacter sp. S5]NDI78246.1 biotin--[acetyl-CoA-carboxylase] ligase [Psychrilyobacter piezotolerans]RDE61195.1 biotin--[acetyl-CoA-carboxylase] ligase [Psychrilyobacter sp. S5]REI40863.1 biotin--[acetyl-CoA-carboxylase] ligase [Psychrilyobacter piezotolerans]